MLERMRDQMRKGDKEALRRMLSQLRDMMQNMRPGQQQQRKANRNHPAEKMMRQMGDLMRGNVIQHLGRGHDEPPRIHEPAAA